MEKLWHNHYIKAVTIILGWFIILTTVITYAINHLPFNPTFPYYNQDIATYYNRFWGTFAHFDGIHYLRIAAAGEYPGGGQVAFFPFYPFLIHGLINVGVDPLMAGIIISLVALVLSIVILSDLYPETSWKFTLLLLSFPTSFFFGILYTESLYLLLFVLMLFFIRRQKYYLAALAVALSTATRFVGVGMALYLLLIIWDKLKLKQIIGIGLVSISGLLTYMGYLWKTIGDPLAFVHVQPSFGMGRSGGEIILLPQVIFRYLKMLFLAAPTSLVYYRALAELLIFTLVVYALLKVWRTLSRAELVYTLTVLLIPTFSGTLSSYPRYILAAIPLFAALASHFSPTKIIFISIISSALLVVSLGLFTQGLFVA